MKENENQEPSNMAGAAKGGTTSKKNVGSAVSAAVGEPIGIMATWNKGGSGEHNAIEPYAKYQRGERGYSLAQAMPEGTLLYAAGLPVSAAEQPDDLPRLPAPTRLHYGLHYRADDMEAYARDAVDMALARQSQAKPVEQANEQWLPAEQAAFSTWAIIEFPNESSQGLISLGSAWKQGQQFERLAATTQVSAPQAIPDVLFDGYAVYKEVLTRSPNPPRTSPDNVAEVLDAVVCLIRAGAPQAGQEAQASAAQEVRAVPEGLERLTRYMFTHEGMEVDNACGRYYLADEVDAFVERRLAAPTSTSTAPAAPDEMTGAARDVLAERRRQVDAEGWTPEHDDVHADGQIAGAAACYAVAGITHWARYEIVKTLWPWPDDWWKPSNDRRNLVKAGALILAEIERIDRAALRTTTATGADSTKGDA